MTILEKTEDGVHCIWFNNNTHGGFQQEVGVFLPSALKAVGKTQLLFGGGL